MNSFTIHYLDLHLRFKESVNLQNCQCKIDNIDIYNVNLNQELEVHLLDPHLLLSLVGKARDECDETRNECPCICCHRISMSSYKCLKRVPFFHLFTNVHKIIIFNWSRSTYLYQTFNLSLHNNKHLYHKWLTSNIVRTTQNIFFAMVLTNVNNLKDVYLSRLQIIR